MDIASVEGTTGSESLSVLLRGDSAFPTTHQAGSGASGDMGRAGSLGTAGTLGNRSVDDDTNDDLIWSPVSTSTSPAVADFDFTNGYQVLGLPANDMPSETFTSAN